MKKVINNKWVSIVLGEETLRKLYTLDIQADDKEQVKLALENFKLEHKADEAYGRDLIHD